MTSDRPALLDAQAALAEAHAALHRIPYGTPAFHLLDAGDRAADTAWSHLEELRRAVDRAVAETDAQKEPAHAV